MENDKEQSKTRIGKGRKIILVFIGIISLILVVSVNDGINKKIANEQKILEQKEQETLVKKAFELTQEQKYLEAIQILNSFKSMNPVSFEKVRSTLYKINLNLYQMSLSKSEIEQLFELCLDVEVTDECRNIVGKIPDVKYAQYVKGENDLEIIKEDSRYLKVIRDREWSESAQERLEKQESRERLIGNILNQNPHLTRWQAGQLLDQQAQALQIRLEYQERSKAEQCRYGDTYFILGTDIQGRCH